jgi:hypothetical protein
MVRSVAEDPSEQRVLDDIAEYGWHCVHILEDDEGAGYSFTIGLWATYGHPELIVFGLPAQAAHTIVSTVARAAAEGEPLDPDRPTDALLHDYSCWFAPVPRAQYHDHVGYARWYYQGDEFPLRQIVWPSRAGVFPWDERASAEFRAAQPLIGETPAAALIAAP